MDGIQKREVIGLDRYGMGWIKLRVLKRDSRSKIGVIGHGFAKSETKRKEKMETKTKVDRKVSKTWGSGNNLSLVGMTVDTNTGVSKKTFDGCSIRGR